MKSITVGDMTKYSVRLVHFRSINVNKNLGQNEKFFWILWLRQVRLIWNGLYIMATYLFINHLEHDANKPGIWGTNNKLPKKGTVGGPN